MENGISPGGNGDRHDPSSPPDRRKTVSGAIPQLDHEDDDRVTPIETMRFPWSSPSAPTTPLSPTTSPPAAIKSPGHKRTFSGNLLSRFGFGRNGSEEGRPPSRSERPSSRDKDIPSPTKSLFSRKSTDDDAPLTSPTSPNGEKQSALATALRQSKTRKRKGSLRKTALLGGRRIVTEGRDRKGSLALLQRTPSTKQIKILAQQQNAQQQEEAVVDLSASTDGEATTTPAANGGSEPSLRRQFSYEKPTEPSNSDSDWSAVSAARLSLLAEQKDQAAAEPVPQPQASKFLGSPLDTGTLTSYASTTDDDDLPSFQTRSKLLQPQQTQSSATTSSLNAPLSSAVTSHYQSQSCYPSQTSLTRRHSNKALNAPTPSPPPEIHSYIETEWWGWIILTFTWLAFTVGMGSCLDLWSWAWDVGETPYAPPELEDDPTLPIVGYYPALTVLTGVVAWVWITVAWVGMKYFRHAKIEV